MTPEEAEKELLGLANEKGKFAIQLAIKLDDKIQEAFERGIDQQWFTLVDLGPIADQPYRMMRVFRLTDAGWERKKELEEGPWKA